MAQFKVLLRQLNACNDAKEWAADKTWEEVYKTCHRGDWLLWLYAKTNPDDLRGLTLAKGLCANTVRHLMQDERSVKAVDAAISFGKGEISRDDLKAAVSAAVSAAYAAAHADAYSAVAYAAAAAAVSAAYDAAYADAYSAVSAADDAAYARYAAAYAAAHADAYSAVSAAACAAGAYSAADAKKENQEQTADIVRSVLPIEMWNIIYNTGNNIF